MILYHAYLLGLSSCLLPAALGSLSSEELFSLVQRALKDSREHQMAMLSGREPNASAWSEGYCRMVEVARELSDYDGDQGWQGGSAVALRMDEENGDDIDAVEFFQARSTKHKRLVSMPNFSPHGYLMKVTASKKRLSLVDFESGYGEIFTLTLPEGGGEAAARLAVGALTHASGHIVAAVGGKIAILFIEVKSPTVTAEERSRWRNINMSAFVDRPPNVTVWSSSVVDVGSEEIIDHLLVMPSGRASTASNTSRVVAAAQSGRVRVVHLHGDILSTSPVMAGLIGIVPLGKARSSHAVLAYGSDWARLISIGDEVNDVALSGIDQWLVDRRIMTMASGDPLGPMATLFATLDDGGVLALGLKKHRKGKSKDEGQPPSYALRGLFSLPTCKHGKPLVRALEPHLVVIVCGRVLSVYDITVARKQSLRAVRRGSWDDTTVMDAGPLWEEVYRVTTGLPTPADGVTVWRREAVYSEIAIHSEGRVRVLDIMIPRERDLTLESEQAMWNYFRACLGLLCAIGVITYMYFSLKPKRPEFYEPSYIAQENPPLPPTLASGG
ncbi:hypothetical protein FOZ61_007629 [Perkinsus olseni]|uniref:ER membrane protein complex subunit 1 n=1 Tax=Perkinsus olseni TaxID=32597 RepID=A0A7J6LCX6_PEROL|nr:hypothetical protein FOZ61_007629 [Perkinsus olseni]KAF4656850.1 hypothetical protein FOL46_007646 [Perkinsus olseni]